MLAETIVPPILTHTPLYSGTNKQMMQNVQSNGCQVTTYHCNAILIWFAHWRPRRQFSVFVYNLVSTKMTFLDIRWPFQNVKFLMRSPTNFIVLFSFCLNLKDIWRRLNTINRCLYCFVCDRETEVKLETN